MAVAGVVANTVMVLATVTMVMIATMIGGQWTRDPSDQQQLLTCSTQNSRTQCESTNNCVWFGETEECKESKRFPSTGIKSSSNIESERTLCANVVTSNFSRFTASLTKKCS